MRSREGGQVAPLALGLALLCFAVAGLAVDGTRAFLLRRTLQNAADSAALAAASEIDRVGYYLSSGRRVRLDVDYARRVAAAWLRRRAVSSAAAVDASAERVTVVLRDQTPTLFLRLIGIDHVSVAVEAVAEPFAGPARASAP